MQHEGVVAVHRETLRGARNFLVFRRPVGEVADEFRLERRDARYPAELRAGAFRLGAVFGTGLEEGVADAGGRGAGIDVALPVAAGYDAAFPAFHRPVEEGLRRVGVHFRQDERGAPGADGVAGRIGSFRGQPLIVLRKDGTLVEAGIRPHPEVVGLRPEADLLDGRDAVDEQLVNLRGVGRIDLESERLAVDDPRGVEAPDGVALGLRQPRAVQPLRLAPHISHNVVRERLPDGIGRRRQALHQIGQFILREIQLNILRPKRRNSGQQQEKQQDLFHISGYSANTFRTSSTGSPTGVAEKVPGRLCHQAYSKSLSDSSRVS